MSWRTVVISSRCKLNYKNNYLIIRNDKSQMIHLSEIHTLIVDTTLVSITTYLISELMKRKIKLIFCDEKRNPQGEVVPYYGSHNTSKRIRLQSSWHSEFKELIWTNIVKQKITNQASLLKEFNYEENSLLYNYVKEVKTGDITNREGHAAKVYFNALFGMSFKRNLKCNINAALDYGYSIILSTFNKEIVGKGYLTQIGIQHRNEFNYFNLSCDLMEPFRILVDKIVYINKNREFDKEYKMLLVDLLNEKISLGGKKYYFTNAINIYTKSVLDVLDSDYAEELLEYKYEL